MYSISLALGFTSDRNLLWIRTQSLINVSLLISGKPFAGYEYLEITETVQAVTASVTRILSLAWSPRRLESRAAAGSETVLVSLCFAKHSLLQLWENRKWNMSSSQVWKKWVSPYMVCSSFCALNCLFSGSQWHRTYYNRDFYEAESDFCLSWGMLPGKLWNLQK